MGSEPLVTDPSGRTGDGTGMLIRKRWNVCIRNGTVRSGVCSTTVPVVLFVKL